MVPPLRLVAEPAPEKDGLVFHSNLLSRIAEPPSLTIVAFKIAELLVTLVADAVVEILFVVEVPVQPPGNVQV